MAVFQALFLHSCYSNRQLFSPTSYFCPAQLTDFADLFSCKGFSRYSCSYSWEWFQHSVGRTRMMNLPAELEWISNNLRPWASEQVFTDPSLLCWQVHHKRVSLSTPPTEWSRWPGLKTKKQFSPLLSFPFYDLLDVNALHCLNLNVSIQWWQEGSVQAPVLTPDGWGVRKALSRLKPDHRIFHGDKVAGLNTAAHRGASGSDVVTE